MNSATKNETYLKQKPRQDSTPRSQFHHVCDIVPTIYEAGF